MSADVTLHSQSTLGGVCSMLVPGLTAVDPSVLRKNLLDQQGAPVLRPEEVEVL